MASRHADHAMDLGQTMTGSNHDMCQTMLVAGIGCRAGVSAEQVESALAAALRLCQSTPPPSLQIATPTAKSCEPGIIAAAASRGLPLVVISQAELEAANPRTLTRSEHSMIVMNVHSVAEAAALAGAGPTSRLLGPRIVVGPVTCALARATTP